MNRIGFGYDLIVCRIIISFNCMKMLTDFQKDIVTECLQKRRGCMSIPMGAGKTLMALEMCSRIYQEHARPTLFVCSKTLTKNCVQEIAKFKDESFKFAVFHKEDMNEVDMMKFNPDGYHIVIITIDVLWRVYRELKIADRFIEKQRIGPNLLNYYNIPQRPFLSRDAKGFGSFLYSTIWGCLIIDEVQTYTNIMTYGCQSICSIFAIYRWAMSGTPIDEPKIERLMGYYYIIGDGRFPRSKPETLKYVKLDFKGMQASMVIRKQEDLDYDLPEYEEIIIEHGLTDVEIRMYETLKEILRLTVKYKNDNFENKLEVKKANECMLTLILYFREFLVCPYVPYRSMIDDIKKPKLIVKWFKIVTKRYEIEFKTRNSTRIKEMIKILEKHKDERCIMFNNFRQNQNYCEHYIKKTNRPIFVMHPSQDSDERIALLQDFETSDNGVLLLTFQLGATGLNIQCCRIVLIADTWWNNGRVQQAIARVYRRGQNRKVFAYLFTANTGMEINLFKKQVSKRELIGKVMKGKVNSLEIEKLNVTQMCKIIMETKDVYDYCVKARSMIIDT